MKLTKIAHATPFLGVPKINLPAVYGASSKKPFLLRIPVIGERPVVYGAEGLPEGLELRGNIISGAALEEGCYEVTVTAENALGKTEKVLTLEIAENNILCTPLLGFTTWNAFGDSVTQENAEDTAKKMLETGLCEYGYCYVNIDSGWQHEYGGEYDAIQPNPKFPDMKAFADKIHAMGLKCGIYSTPMLTAWGCPKEYTSIPGCTVGEADIRFAPVNGGIGVIHKEENNAKQWADWGFDYLKYDWSPTDTVNAELMRKALLAADRDFGFCVTTRAHSDYSSYWSKYCSSFRDGIDSLGYWDNLLELYDSYFPHVNDMNKGHFFDLDMLDIGDCWPRTVRGDGYLTEQEQIFAYSHRAFCGSPIQISAKLENLSRFELDLFCNEEIIAINQDAAFCPALPVFERVENGSYTHVFEKKLEDGTYAYGIFNAGSKEETYSFGFEEDSLVRDLWSKEDIGVIKNVSFTLEKHTARIVKCQRKAKCIS